MADQDKSTQPTPGHERQSAEEKSVSAHAVAATTAFVHAATRDGTIPAMGREALKDLYSTLMETFFSHPDHGREPGAPLNPTQGEVAASREEALPSPADIAHDRGVQEAAPERGSVHGPAMEATPLPSPGDIAHDRGVHGPESESGNVHGPAMEATPLPSPSDIAHDRDGGQVLEQRIWQDRIERERGQSNQGGGEDGYDRQKERIKPEEERQKEKEQERDGGGRGGRC